MLRHTGYSRSFEHNLRLAILLSLNAGFINAAGFVAFAVLTTNVTGHAALLAVSLATNQLRTARMVALWLALFFAGSFCSSFYIQWAGSRNRQAYSIPIVVIIGILGFITFFGRYYDHSLLKTEYFAGSLLFAMGMQNALVSMISGSVVRTTHLTGMMTDLGIDLSEAVTNRDGPNPALRRRMGLRLAIVFFFLLGGLFGAWAYGCWNFTAFLIPVGLLSIALVYDHIRINVIRTFRQRRGGGG